MGRNPKPAGNQAVQSSQSAARREATALIIDGNANSDVGDYDGAIACYERAIEVDREIALARSNLPDIVIAYNRRGAVNLGIGDYDGAVADCDRAIELAPNNPSAYFYRGCAEGIIGNELGAIASLNQSIELNPVHALSYIARGTAKARQNDLDGATEDFNQFVALDDSNSLLDTETLSLFYDIRQKIALAAERERLQTEQNQILEVADHEYDTVASERDQLANENFQLRERLEQFTKAAARKEQVHTFVALPTGAVQVRYYQDVQGRQPFTEDWFPALSRDAQNKIRNAIRLMRDGDFGGGKKHKSVHASGVSERRINSGPGYRIYYAKLSDSEYLILGGGDKGGGGGKKANKPQNRDIDTAAERLADWRTRCP